MAVLKTHVALNVTDIEKSVEFYRAMFGVAPVKHKPDYAKFDLTNPALNLTLTSASSLNLGGTLSHLGVQVESPLDVQAATKRLNEAGLTTFVESDTDCCYALQDKVWVTDPDGNRWEIFVVKVGDTAPNLNMDATSNPALIEKAATKPCCA